MFTVCVAVFDIIGGHPLINPHQPLGECAVFEFMELSIDDQVMHLRFKGAALEPTSGFEHVEPRRA